MNTRAAIWATVLIGIVLGAFALSIKYGPIFMGIVVIGYAVFWGWMALYEAFGGNK